MRGAGANKMLSVPEAIYPIYFVSFPLFLLVKYFSYVIIFLLSTFTVKI